MRALDLGCGNGLFCCMLACGGIGHVTGVDYADSAVELAQGVRLPRCTASMSCSLFVTRMQVTAMFPADTRQRCVFKQMDVLGGGSSLKALAVEGGGFDLVHDCGLLDSVAMVIISIGYGSCFESYAHFLFHFAGARLGSSRRCRRCISLFEACRAVRVPQLQPQPGRAADHFRARP